MNCVALDLRRAYWPGFKSKAFNKMFDPILHQNYKSCLLSIWMKPNHSNYLDLVHCYLQPCLTYANNHLKVAFITVILYLSNVHDGGKL